MSIRENLRDCKEQSHDEALPECASEERGDWCVEYGDIYGNVSKTWLNEEADAIALHAELAGRNDIEWVEDPVHVQRTGEAKASYDDYTTSVKFILMGREFEYGPETAAQFVDNDYKEIVRKNYDAGKSAFTSAADIDAAYMGTED